MVQPSQAERFRADTRNTSLHLQTQIVWIHTRYIGAGEESARCADAHENHDAVKNCACAHDVEKKVLPSHEERFRADAQNTQESEVAQMNMKTVMQREIV
jgi:hypothetical protein